MLPVFAAHSFESARGAVATQMQDDKHGVDGSRYFVFDFFYANQTGRQSDAICSVEVLVINNSDCDGRGMGMSETDPAWFKSELFSTDTGHKISCDLQVVGGGRKQLVIEYSDFDGTTFAHRLLLTKERGARKVLDYVGSVSKYSDITQRLEAASYVPLKADDFLGYKEVKMCGRVSLPGLSQD
jgi:hypothetical protein